MIAPDGAFIDCNPAAERLLGSPREELMGRDVEDIGAPEDAELRARVAAGERVETDPVLRRLSGGRSARLQIAGFPVFDPEGKMTAAVWILRDMTERVALGEALRRAQRLEALGRLAGGIAHDFNNMLTVIDGFATIAGMHMPPGAGVEALDQVRGAAARGQQLTQRLLAFARSQSSEPTSLLVHDVFEALLPSLRRLAGDGVQVTLDAAPVPPVRADRAQLEQVLVNLVVNARDACSDGGDITIAVRPERVEALVPDGPAPGDHVRIDVTDTGGGMAAETLERIFEPFFTTKNSELRGSGTGLGLASVHGSVAQAGGHIAVESAPGAGARFTIRLPVDPDPVSPPAPDLPAAVPARGSERILVCEDEPQVLALVRRILEDAGYDVTGTQDPAEALDLAVTAAEPFDLLVSDVLMPGMSGPDLAERLRDERPGVPVLFMSGYAAESFEGSDWLRRSVLVSKPFAREQLLDAVRTELDAHNTGA